MRERRKKRCGSKTRTEYGVFGRSTGYAINGTRQTTIAYDTYGRISTMTIPTTENGENVHSPTPTQNPNSFQWSYLQGSDLKSSLTYPNGLTASWTYDANNQLLQVRNATPTNVVSQFDYTYDASGRRVSIAKSGTAFGDLSGSVDTYTYNLRSELTSARRTKNGQPIPGFSEDFDYDPIGNRRSSTTYNEKSEAQTSTYEANNLNQYTSRTTPGYAAVRGEADPNATVTVNENPTFRLGSYYFGSDLFDNTTSSGFANLLTYATLAQTAANGEEADDLISATTNQVYIAQSPEPFAYDDDGNQTLVTTKTGLWRVTYNGENRPILWVRDSDGMTLTMSYDHMGRRREKNNQRFFYDGYLQVYNSHSPTPTLNSNSYIWDCTESVATRPLAWFNSAFDTSHSALYYTHDGNKNVSEVIAANCDLAAHYDYAPFGAVISQRGTFAAANPWRFSSEFADDELGCDYYNYREYEPVSGRWMSRDPIQDYGICDMLYQFIENDPVSKSDVLGNKSNPGNRMPGIPPPRPAAMTYVPIPEGPAVRSDGSMVDAWASAFAMTYRSEVFVKLFGVSVCARRSPYTPAPLPPEKGTAIRACNCKCCVVSYLVHTIGDNDLFYLESAAVFDMPCANAKLEPGIWAVYPNFARRFYYKDWR